MTEFLFYVAIATLLTAVVNYFMPVKERLAPCAEYISIQVDKHTWENTCAWREGEWNYIERKVMRR